MDPASIFTVIYYLIKTIWFVIKNIFSSRDSNFPKQTILITNPIDTSWQMLDKNSDTHIMLINGKLTITNISNKKFRAISSKLKMPFNYPKFFVFGQALIRSQNENVYGSYIESGFELKPDQTTNLLFLFHVYPPHKKAGENFYCEISIIDQFGNDHWVKNLFIPSINKIS